jgi:glycosyltransferase involved in cell wall biosynthesis
LNVVQNAKVANQTKPFKFGINLTALSVHEKEKLRVLLSANTMTHGGGAETLVFDIFNALKRRPDVHVKLVTFQKAFDRSINDSTHLEDALLKDPDFCHSSSYVNLSVTKPNKTDVVHFTGIVKDFRPHIIHSNLFIAELITHEAIFPGIKYFTHCHDNMPQLRNFSLKTLTQKNLLTDFYEKRHLIKRYLQCNNKFISISADTTKYFEEVLPQQLKKNIYPLSNAIVVKNFHGADKERDLSTIRIVNVGSFLTKKNQQFLVDIALILKQRDLAFEIVMLGEGTDYEKVKAKVKAAGLEKQILMPGNTVNVADYYAAANVYVHVALYEPFGLVLLEAMASGLPVVTLDGKGNRDLIKEGENGYMINDQNAAAFADAIEKAVKDRDTYAAMSINATAFAQKYDIEEYINKLVSLYRLS